MYMTVYCREDCFIPEPGRWCKRRGSDRGARYRSGMVPQPDGLSPAGSTTAACGHNPVFLFIGGFMIAAFVYLWGWWLPLMFQSRGWQGNGTAVVFPGNQ